MVEAVLVVVRALGVGRPVLVSAGSAAAEEFPEGVVVPIDPGRREEAELEAFLHHLHGSPNLRGAIGELAAVHVRRHHRLAETMESLAGFLRAVEGGKSQALAALKADRTDAGGLLGYFMEEVRGGARDLGLAEVRLGLEGLFEPLARGAR